MTLRRVGFLFAVTVAAAMTMAAMSIMSAGSAFATHNANHGGGGGGGGGGGDFQTFCGELGGTFNDLGTPGANDDTCTTIKTDTKTEPYENRSREAGQSGRGFDQQGTQDVTTTTTTTLDKKNDNDPQISTNTTRSDPVITGCTNPGGKEVSTTNPNCQANKPGKP